MNARVRRTGLTVLEVMVALVILGLVMGGFLQLFHVAHRLAERSREWSAAIGYATDAMERTKLVSSELREVPLTPLPPGFDRHVTVLPWRPGLALVSVTVVLPGGGHFDLQRLEQSGGRVHARQTAFDVSHRGVNADAR